MNYRVSTLTGRIKCKKKKRKSIFVPFSVFFPAGPCAVVWKRPQVCVHTRQPKYKVAITEHKQIPLPFVCLFVFLVSDNEHTQTRQLLVTKGIKSGESVFRAMSGYLPATEVVV